VLDEIKLCHEQMDGVETDVINGPARMVTIVLQEFDLTIKETGYYESPVVNLYFRSKAIPIPKAWLRQYPQYWAQHYIMTQVIEWTDQMIIRWIEKYPEHYKDAYAHYKECVWFEISLWENKCLVRDVNTLNMDYSIKGDVITFRRWVKKTNCCVIYKQNSADYYRQYAWIVNSVGVQRYNRKNPSPSAYAILLSNKGWVKYRGLMVEDVELRTSRASLQKMFFGLSLNGLRRLSNMIVSERREECRNKTDGSQNNGLKTVRMSYFKPHSKGQELYGIVPVEKDDWLACFRFQYSGDDIEKHHYKSFDLRTWFHVSDRSQHLEKISDGECLFGPRYNSYGTGAGFYHVGNTYLGSLSKIFHSRLSDDACEVT